MSVDTQGRMVELGYVDLPVLPETPEDRAVAAIEAFIADPGSTEKAEAATRLHYKAYYRGSTGRTPYVEVATPILQAVPAATLRVMIKTMGDGGWRPELQQWLRLLLERYDGKVRWMRKEYLKREDGQDKHATIGTRVISLRQREQYHGTQGEIPAGWHGVVEASGASDSRAKAAVGTMSALQVRFDPEVVVEEPAPEKEAPARKAKASPGTSRLGVALLEEPWNQEIVWVIDATDQRDGKPTERHWRPKGWPLSSLYVQDSRQDASLSPRGRYKVQFIQRGVPADAFYGGLSPDAANREYLKPGMGFDTLEGVRDYLKEHWELNREKGGIS